MISMSNSNSNKFLSFLKSNEGKQIIGLVLGVIGCVICWGNNRFGFLGLRYVDGSPNFTTGLMSILLLGVIYIRGIVDFSNSKFKLPTMLVYITIFATFFALLCGKKDVFSILFGNTFMVVVSVFCFTMLLFGMRGITKVSIIIAMLLWFYDRMKPINKAFGYSGFLVLLFWFSCFYCLENIDVQQLMSDLKLLYGKAKPKISNAFSEAADDMQDIGEMAAEVSSASMGVPNPMNANKKKNHSSSAPEQSVDSDDGNLSFFKNHSSCLFSTAVGCIGDGKPVDYLYRFEKFWIFVEDSSEVSSISTNPNVSMIISDKGKEVKVDGTAEIVKPEMPEYNFYLRYKQIPLETIKALPVNMQLIKVSTTNVSVE